MATIVSRRRFLFLELVLALCAFSGFVKCGEIPSFIDICKRNDPDVSKCVTKSIMDLKPMLLKGIPELKVPPMDPIVIPLLPLIVEGISHDSFCKDIYVHGMAAFDVTDCKVDLEKRDFAISFTVPEIYLEGHLEVVVNQMKLNGSGPFKANATGIKVSVVLFDKLVERDGKQYMNFTECQVTADIGTINMQVGDVFHGKMFLANLTNEFVNENPSQMIHTILPSMQKLVSDMVLEAANDLSSKFSYDELFPAS